MKLNSKIIFPLLVFITGCLNLVGAQTMVCPAVRTTSGWLDLFPLPCQKHAECRVMGTQHLCCKGYCTKGVKPAPIRAETETDQLRRSVASTSSTSTSTTTTPSSSSTSTSTTTTTASTTSMTTTSRTSTTTPSTTSSTTTTTTTTPRPTTTVDNLSVLRPFLHLLPIQTTKATPPKKAQAQQTHVPVPVKPSKNQKFLCPAPGRAPLVLFPIPCENNGQCRASSGPDQVCCERRCVKGVPAPRPTSPPISHQPLLGVIPRECPSAPLGELLFEVQACTTDADCWPRLCCPDGARSYCRTARARLDLVPLASQIDGPVRNFERYLQCTRPPAYDLFPQPCSSSVDCFPNLCCAEGGKRHCRPPQRSLFSLLAGVSQRVGSTLSNLRQARANINRS